MPVSVLSSFLLYALICEITPGPVNLYSLSAGLRYPLRRLWGFVLGSLTGFSMVMALSIGLTMTIGEVLGASAGVLRYIGAVYILYLALRMARSAGGAEEREVAPPAFRTALLLQITNVKTILFCVTTLSAYVLPYTRAPLTIVLCGLLLPVTGAACNLLWIAAGGVLQRFLSRWSRPVNWVLAALLALCAAQLAGIL